MTDPFCAILRKSHKNRVAEAPSEKNIFACVERRYSLLRSTSRSSVWRRHSATSNFFVNLAILHKCADATYAASCTIWLQAAYLLTFRAFDAIAARSIMCVAAQKHWMYRHPYRIHIFATASRFGWQRHPGKRCAISANALLGLNKLVDSNPFR